AITYHRRLRSKANLRTVLDEIPGVGPARRRALLRRFGSVKRLRDAAVDEIAGTEGVSEALAASIHAHLHAGS
ncbi:MAG: excinuclease ABC subunit C, partial [Myxococcales bacterium]|nr:excinuclease ABC subunit C [Myxococcales bacterium]